jgi:TonB family protein
MRVAFTVPFLLTAFVAPLYPQTVAPPTTAAATETAAPPPTSSVPEPNASGTYSVGHGVTPPKLLHNAEPQYSREARKKKLSGVSLVNLIVDAQGNPRNVHIARSMADSTPRKLRKAALSLDQQALEAVQQYQFSPATLQGKPVPVEINVEVNFQIF